MGARERHDSDKDVLPFPSPQIQMAPCGVRTASGVHCDLTSPVSCYSGMILLTGLSLQRQWG